MRDVLSDDFALRRVPWVYGSYFDELPNWSTPPQLEGRLPLLSREEVETAFRIGVNHCDRSAAARYLDAYGGPLFLLGKLSGHLGRLRAEPSVDEVMHRNVDPMTLAYLLRATKRPEAFKAVVCASGEWLFEKLLNPRSYGASRVSLYLRDALVAHYAGDPKVAKLLERFQPTANGWTMAVKSAGEPPKARPQAYPQLMR